MTTTCRDRELGITEPDPPKPICKTAGCGKEKKWKGLCQSCYGQAKRLIEDNKTTWEELAKLGLIEQDFKPFYAAFEKAKATQIDPLV